MLIATAITGTVQALIGGQPLLIIGVAEPIVLIYSFMYSFAQGVGWEQQAICTCHGPAHPPFMQCMQQELCMGRDT